MSKKRYVNSKFWDDSYIVSLSVSEKLLFLYFLTNPLTELAGAYEITLSRICFDTKLQQSQVAAILKKFDRDNKIVWRDGWVLIINFQEHQAINPKIEQGIARTLTACPDWVKDRLSKPIKDFERDSYFNSNSNSKKETSNEVSKKKGTRIPDPFLLTAEMRQYAKDQRPEVDVNLETEKFCNYWRAKTGRDATKLDWPATWRNWILNARSSNGTTKRDRPTSADNIRSRDYSAFDGLDPVREFAVK